MRRSKVRAEPEEDVKDGANVRREPIPTARAILWKPLPDSYHLLASMMRAPEKQNHLFITQRAFLQVERHLGSGPDLDLAGFLAGHLYECPRTRVRYSIVNTIVPLADVTGEPISHRVTEREYNAVRKRLDAHGLALIGWYRNGAGLGLQLLPDDVETHLAYFSEPWQTTMLVLPDAARPRGAFFTYDARAGRGYCIPFHELFDADGTDREHLARTCVTWRSYVPAVSVQPMPAEDREIVETTVKPIRSQPEPEPPDPVEEWWEAIKDPWVRIRDVAVSAGKTDHEELVPLAWRPADAPPPVAVPLETPPASLPAAKQEPQEAVRPGRPSSLPPPNVAAKVASRPAPPFSGPTAAPRAASQKASSPSSAERPAARAVDPLRTTSHPATRERAKDPAPSPPKAQPRSVPPSLRFVPAAATAAATAAVAKTALAPDFEEETKRSHWLRRIGFTIAGLSFLSVIVLASVYSRPDRLAQAATSGMTQGDSTGSADAAAPIAPSADSVDLSIALPSAVDSLSRAISYYRGVEQDHRMGLAGCRALDRAHAGVVRARARVDSSRRRVPGGLNIADSLRVSMIRAEYTHVAQMYRRSGCQP